MSYSILIERKDILSIRLNVARDELKYSEEDARSLWLAMGFRDRHLGGWFGGDRMLSKVHGELESKVELNRQAVRTIMDSQSALEKEIVDFLETTLEGNNATYQLLLEGEKLLRPAILSVEELQRRTSHALNEVSDAQLAEVFDMMSSNKGVALVSTLVNSGASDAIKDVKAQIEITEQALENYQQGVGGLNADGSMTVELIDLALDLEFMSLLSYLHLSNAEEDLKQLQSRVTTIEKALSEKLELIEKVKEGMSADLRGALDEESLQNKQAKAITPEQQDAVLGDLMARASGIEVDDTIEIPEYIDSPEAFSAFIHNVPKA